MRGGALALLLLASCGEAAFQDNGVSSDDGNSMKQNEEGRLEVVAATGPTKVDGARLILEFPDGVRGGKGKIQGTGPRSSFPEPGKDGIIPDYFDHLLRVIRECGAVEPYLGERWSHSFFVVSRSTADDRKVIECLRRTTSLHFTPRLSSNGPVSGPDANPFEDLFTGTARPAPRK